MPIGIVIGNLGTPQSSEPADVKKYLEEFLMDRYVIDRPFWLRWILVHVLITPWRAKKSAAAYRLVWRPDGSPLLAITQRLVQKLRKTQGPDFQIEIGMRYGEPSTKSALARLKNCERILLFPQYPEYAESSYRTWMEDALSAARELGISEHRLSAVEPFYACEDYLAALAERAKLSLKNIDYDHLLLSFHGLPESHLKKTHGSGTDCASAPQCQNEVSAHSERCYRAQCYLVARELARRLDLDASRFSVSFQSRLGREPWIQPFTDQVVQALPARGVKKLAVAMPAFTVDCLETLEEISLRAKDDFLKAGGEEFTAVPCLNDDDPWVRALSSLIAKSLASPVKPCP